MAEKTCCVVPGRLKIRNSTGEVKVMSVTNVLLMVFNVLFSDYNSLERYFTGTIN